MSALHMLKYSPSSGLTPWKLEVQTLMTSAHRVLTLFADAVSGSRRLLCGSLYSGA